MQIDGLDLRARPARLDNFSEVESVSAGQSEDNERVAKCCGHAAHCVGEVGLVMIRQQLVGFVQVDYPHRQLHFAVLAVGSGAAFVYKLHHIRES